MDLYDLLAILITLTAFFSYINYKYIHLPTTIGVMLISLLMSLGLIGLGWLGLGIEARHLFIELLLHRVLIGSQHTSMLGPQNLMMIRMRQFVQHD